MKIDATTPLTSPTIPPPKAISRLPRSPPACAICRSKPSTLLSVLCFSPGSRNIAIGAWAKEPRKACPPQPPEGRGGQQKTPPRQFAHDPLNPRRKRLNQPAARHHVILRRRCL